MKEMFNFFCAARSSKSQERASTLEVALIVVGWGRPLQCLSFLVLILLKFSFPHPISYFFFSFPPLH